MLQRLVAFYLACFALCGLATSDGPVVNTTKGPVRGKVDSSTGVEQFLSIPFGKPPVGDLRYLPPVAPDMWMGTLDVSKESSACPQMEFGSTFFYGSEDCLYVKVFVPKGARTSSEPLPVMFWIFGGAFSLGDGSEFGLYDGTHLANTYNVIIVAHNYRTGALGYLAHPALANENHGTTGNMGLQDQRMAMQWVQDNIANFGGDPNRVTIFGESSGAFSVCAHLGSGQYSGLFSAAIIESGDCNGPLMELTLEEAIDFGKLYAKSVGCVGDDDAEVRNCLRALTTAQAMNGDTTTQTDDDTYNDDFLSDEDRVVSGAGGGLTHRESPVGDEAVAERYLHNLSILEQKKLTMLSGRATAATPVLPSGAPTDPWGIVIDGTSEGMLKFPFESIRDGTHNRVPVMLGTNNDEGSTFMFEVTKIVPNVKMPLNDVDMEVTVAKILPHVNSTRVVEHYPVANYGGNLNTRAEMTLRDSVFLCPARNNARALVAQGSDVFLYQFTYSNYWPDMKILGTYHFSELFFLFGNQWPPVVHYYYTQADKDVSSYFGQLWTNFAKYHDPNGANGEGVAGVVWPRYDAQTDSNLVINSKLSVSSGLNRELCDMWDEELKGGGK